MTRKAKEPRFGKFREALNGDAKGKEKASVHQRMKKGLNEIIVIP
jgi:hypothetical protein